MRAAKGTPRGALRRISGEILPFHVLHLDEEVSVIVAVSENANNPVIKSAEPGLQNRATTLGFDDLLPVRVRTLIDELERYFLVCFGINRKIDTAHAAQRKELYDFVLAELTRVHAYRVLWPRFWLGGLGAGELFCSVGVWRASWNSGAQ